MEILHTFLELLAYFLGVVAMGMWTAFKSSDYFRDQMNERSKLMLSIMEQAAARTYYDRVEPYKRQYPGQKLTMDQVENFRNATMAIFDGMSAGTPVQFDGSLEQKKMLVDQAVRNLKTGIVTN